jgi:hypothetical protein
VGCAAYDCLCDRSSSADVSHPGAEGFAPILESQNTQSPSLSFRALLTEGGDPRVNMHRV